MKKATITYLLNQPILCPGGGMKIILEYANRFVADGYNVNIVYPATLNWRTQNLKYKLKSIYHYFRHEMLGWKCCRWFNLDSRVNEIHSISLNYCHVPKSDIYVATEVRTAPYVSKYPIDNARKFYFAQDYENWFVDDEFVLSTYRMPLNKVSISKWLQRRIESIGEKSYVVPNGFDFTYFTMYKMPELRERHTVSMLYHESPRKDCQTAFKALEIVKSRFSDVKVKIFGTPSRPKELPEWYEYYQCPNKEQHNMIYNEAAIFIGSSVAEGWGLTVGEAMICGAAIVCTDIDGYKEMVEDGKNALLSPIKDYKALAFNIIRLIEDDRLRIKLATQGNHDIMKFNWDSSYKLMKSALNIN